MTMTMREQDERCPVCRNLTVSEKLCMCGKCEECGWPVRDPYSDLCEDCIAKEKAP